MADVWKERDPSPISSPEMIKLLDREEKLKKKIKEFKEKCTHDYETISTCDGWNGYDWVDCEVTANIHCKICGNKEWGVKTGRINRH